MERRYSTWSMPLLNPNHTIKTCGGPETLTSTKLTYKEDLMERRYSTWSMPLLNPNHTIKTCGGPENLTSTKLTSKRI